MPRRRNNPVACVILLPACKAGEAHVGKRVMRRRFKLALSVAGTVMVAVPASAADDPTLQRQLKTGVDQLQAVSQQNQQQINELTRQLQEIQQRNQREVGGLNDQIQTLQATPGSVPPTPAAPVSSGGDRVKLSISGQVDRALLYGNDGKASNLRNVDNNVSSTRLRFVGEGRVTDTMTGGSNLEAEIRPNSSSTTTLTQNLPQPAAAATFTVRQAEGYVQDPAWGGVRLGFGSTASYQTSEIDLSGSFTATYVNVPDIDGGFAFRQRGSARVPSSNTAFVTSPDGAFGPAVGAVFNFFDGLLRDNRIRYDTPMFGGFQFAASLIDGGAFDTAVRYAAKFDGHQFAAGIGFVDADSRRHIPITAISGFPGAPANLYGYAGVPTGSNGTTNLATPVAPNAGDISANGSKQFDGSVSFLMKNGLSLTTAGGYRDVNYRDPIGRKLAPVLIYTKLGYRFAWLPYGDTAVGIDYTQNEEVQFHGDTARAYGIGVVQFVESLGTELFAVAKYQTLNRTFARYDDLIALSTGARVRF